MSHPSSLINTYQRLPVRFTHGKGVWLWDEQGQRYLDAIAGIAVCSLGHAHPAITAAICEQAKQLLHTSNLYTISLQEELAEKLTSITGLARAFFCNSGAEACEAAIKLARLYAHRHHPQRTSIVTMQGAFHGRTLGALAATLGKEKSPFSPLPSGFIKIPFNTMDAVEQVYHHHSDVGAFMLEPIQGEGGIHVADDTYLQDLRSFCSQHNLLLIFDEVQTGVARSGAWYACQHAGVQADILTSAKGLAGGIPIGVCLANEKVADCMRPGLHGSTFGGNPLACRAALAVIHIIGKHKLVQQADLLGNYLLAEVAHGTM